MRKIPTIYVRDWEGTLGPPARFVLDEEHPDCDWVFAGEGVATRKLDGTCCLVRDHVLYRRHEVKVDKRTGELRSTPENFEELETDEATGAKVGWVPVGDGPEDKHHRRAFEELSKLVGWTAGGANVRDGTFELVGPSINGNPELYETNRLIRHDDPSLKLDTAVPTAHSTLGGWLGDYDIEGIVWQHPDGRMAKIKGRDFGIERRRKET